MKLKKKKKNIIELNKKNEKMQKKQKITLISKK